LRLKKSKTFQHNRNKLPDLGYTLAYDVKAWFIDEANRHTLQEYDPVNRHTIPITGDVLT